MKRILFLVLWIISTLGPQAYGAIEIYANGHKYGSLQAYRASKKPAVAQSSPIPGSLDSQQEDYVRQEAKKLGLNVDLSKIKTFQVKKNNLPDKSLHQIYVLGIENGVVNALQDFYQTRGQDDFQIPFSGTSGQLQEAIAKAVGASNEPKLLISEPGKVRILALTSKDST